MQIKQLSASFQCQIANLAEVLHDKNRGYGVVTVQFNTLTFGIPLRTSIKHKNSFITDTVTRNGVICHRGLDFQKALLINNIETDLHHSYKIPTAQRTAIHQAEGKIKNSLTSTLRSMFVALKTMTRVY